MMDGTRTFRAVAAVTGLALSLFAGCTKAKLINHSKTPKLSPSLISVSPPIGILSGGTLLTLTGSGFAAGASVKLGDSFCVDVQVLSSTKLTCRTPSHAAGQVSVILTDPDGETAQLAAGFAFIDASLSAPARGIVAGGGISTGAGMRVQATVGEVSGSVIQTSATVQSLSGVQGVLYQP